MLDSKFLKKIVRLLGMNLPMGSIPILKDWIVSNYVWADKNLDSSQLWVDRLISCANEENIQFDRFYIGLYGLMVDLNEKTGMVLSQIKKSRSQTETRLESTVERLFKDSPDIQRFFKLHIENADIIKKVFKQVGEENLFKIIFLRNKYSHPFLTEYAIKTYLNEESEKIEFDSVKYNKLKSNSFDELELTKVLSQKLITLNRDLEKMANNFGEMRHL